MVLGEIVKIKGKTVKIQKKKGHGYFVDKQGYLREVSMKELKKLRKKKKKGRKR